MIRDDVIYLVNESPAARGIFETPQETLSTAFCRVKSVTRSEFWRAKEHGLEPELVFTLSEYADYGGQKVLLYAGERYRVLRSYVTGHAVELTAARILADAVKPEPPEPEEDEGDAGTT